MNENDKTKLKAIKKNYKRTRIKIPQIAEEFGLVSKQDSDLSLEEIESREFVAQMAKAYAGTIEFYKSEMGGCQTHKEAVERQIGMSEWRRGQIEQKLIHQIEWSDIAAIAEENLADGQSLWLLAFVKKRRTI